VRVETVKKNRPRKSHYLPKFYLAGFTRSGEAGGDLFVFDRATGREWKSSPANTATEKDFYAVDLGPTEDPDVVEKCLAMVESECSRVVRGIVEHEKLPTAVEDFNWFLNFVALMVARTPRMRKLVTSVVDRATKADFRDLFASPEGWSRFKETLAGLGHVVPDDQYEGFKQLADGEEYDVDLDQTSHVQMMVKQMMDALLPALAQRSWSLGVADDHAPDLVCSDAPVSVWPTKDADLTQPITLLTPKTVLSFPLTRRLVAIARYERRGPVLRVIPRGVAMFNTWTLSAARQVISPAPDFEYLGPGGIVCGKEDLRKLSG
jgi:hypothetical protein